ncbi:MAG: sensor domain-containing diguanylate cyclase [Spirochaetales bacterium]|nr:sensor domain-containing diguanylate cyclase [Spirochaetales bacterium]
MADRIPILSTDDYPPAPLSPLLPWSCEKLAGLSGEDRRARLDKLGLPPAHKKLILSYTEGNPREREEPILPWEMEQEEERLYKGVIRLFYSLLPEGTERVKIRVTGNYTHLTESFYNALEEFSPPGPHPPLSLTISGEILPWDGVSRLSPPPDGDGPEEELFHRALGFHLFGDHIRACQYFELLYQKSRRENLSLPAPLRADLFRFYGGAALNLKQEDLALTLFSSLKNLGIALDNSLYTARAYRLTGEVYRRKGERDKGACFFRKSLERGKEDEQLRLEALLALCLCRRLERREREELLSLASKLNRKKSEGIALLYSVPPEPDRALELFREGNHTLLQGEAYFLKAQKKWRSKGPVEEIEGDLNRALALCLPRQGSILETKVLKTLGQLKQNQSKRKEAFNHYRHALEGAVKGERFCEAALIYTRLGELALYGGYSGRSRDYLNTARFILNRTPRSSGPLKERVNLLTGLSFYSEGERDKAEEQLLSRERGKSEANEKIAAVLDDFLQGAPSEEIQKRGEDLLLRPEFRDLGLYTLREGERSLPPDERESYRKLVRRTLTVGENIPEESPGEEPTPSWLIEPIDRKLMDMGLKQFVRYEQLKKGMYEINLLSDIQAILAGTEEKDLLILRTMERLLSSSLVMGISYYERMGDSYRLAYHSSLLEEESDRSDLEEYLRSREERERSGRIVNERRLCLPILLEKILSGVIIFHPETSPQQLREEDNRVFAILAGQFSSALERLDQKELILSKNRQLEEVNRELTISNMTDSLTGIGNRTRMNEMIRQFSHRYNGARERDNFTLLFIDLDNFKFYNDTYGHPLGDRLLELFSRLLIHACRESDRVFRYGGDEFVILLAENSSESSTLIAQRILFDLGEREGFTKLLAKGGYEPPLPREKWLGCSIGISDYRRANKDGNTLLQQVDMALYEAKESGKGQWKIYTKKDKDEHESIQRSGRFY